MEKSFEVITYIKYISQNFIIIKLTRKSIPTVDMKFPERKRLSLNLTSIHVLPTPESPSSIT